MLWEYGVNWMEAECIATPLTQVNYSKSSQKNWDSWTLWHKKLDWLIIFKNIVENDTSALFK